MDKLRKTQLELKSLLFPPLPEKSHVGPLPNGSLSPYAGAAVFQKLPLSIKTKKGLASEKYVKMTDIQRASLPHALCGRDVLGAAKTGSGKTLASVIPMFERLQERKIPIHLSKANQTRLQPVSRLLADLLVKYPDLQSLAQRAFITYLKSIHKQRDKDVFDVTKLPIEKLAESLGLPLIPKVRFLKQKVVRKKSMKEPAERNADQMPFESSRGSIENGMHEEAGLGVDDVFRVNDDQHDDLFIQAKGDQHVVTEDPTLPEDHLRTTKISKKKKKLKININRPAAPCTRLQSFQK